MAWEVFLLGTAWPESNVIFKIDRLYIIYSCLFRGMASLISNGVCRLFFKCLLDLFVCLLSAAQYV